MDNNKQGTIYLWPLLLPTKDPLGGNQPLKHDGQTEYSGDYPELNWTPGADIESIHDHHNPRFPLRFPFGWHPRMKQGPQPIFQVKINENITSVHEQTEAFAKFCCAQNEHAHDFVGFTFFYGAVVNSANGRRTVQQKEEGPHDQDWLVCSSRGLNQRYFPLHEVLAVRDHYAQRIDPNVPVQIKSPRTGSDGAVPMGWAIAMSQAFANRKVDNKK